ncbi:psbP-like [Klebsormidium nitens]|uniref:PsbP-like n=1 Tax=Klebsormidium nitens TaxID=105231 RepID=A0A0U9HL69_KLENI|nr:psbP-like [Klebsormidium nitens]|eukprot:GAQ80600.1 psbP-like [Klebsormidium nitens]
MHSLTRREALGAAAAVLGLSQLAGPVGAAEEFNTFYGKAASASSYGGYGGNAGTNTEAEYVYDVPAGWKERVISKVEKGTNGTDSEWYNPANKKEKIYTTYLGGFRKLGPKENIINDLALSDVKIQDALGSADNFDQRERKDDAGQLYYDYEIDNPGSGHTLITVTVARNKLYAVFVMAPNAAWNKDEKMLRRMWSSFRTI